VTVLDLKPGDLAEVAGLSVYVIEFLQPFIEDKVTHECDLDRQAKVNFAGYGNGFRHRGHTWCHDHRCGCPCHWPRDALVAKLIEIRASYEVPQEVLDWLKVYAKRQTAEAKRLHSLAFGAEKMVQRVEECFGVTP
jgi:hypothetical protein